METAYARNTDPETSHEAAAKVKNLSALKQNIYAILENNELTDEQLVQVYNDAVTEYGFDMHTPQSVRSRRAELVQAGYVRWTGEWAAMTTGGKARTWTAVK